MPTFEAYAIFGPLVFAFVAYIPAWAYVRRQ